MIRTHRLTCIILLVALALSKLDAAQLSQQAPRPAKDRLVPEEADRRQARQEREQELQSQAARFIQQGQLQQAVNLLEQLAYGRQDAGPLIQMLDLQIRLMDMAGARQSMDSLEARLPGDGHLPAYADFQVAGALAGAHYRLGQAARATEMWKSMREEARDESLALALFHSYRQVRLSEEALSWVREQRRKWRKDDLWAFEVALVHEEAGRPQDAFDELALWQCRQQGGSVVESRLLTLAEGARDKPELLRHMLAAVKGKRACAPVGQAVLGVLVQQNWTREATALAWELDTESNGNLPMELAQDLARDGQREACLGLLDEMVKRGRPQAATPELALMRADCLAGLGRAEEALAILQGQASRGGPRGYLAALQAARLLHKPLGRLPEAVRQLEELLARQPADRDAARLLVLLEGCQGHDKEAQAALLRLRSITPLRTEGSTEVDWLGLRLDWWAGRLEACRTAMAAFLKTNTRQDVFNDAIDLMDLLAFSTKDSLGVMEAALADRDAFAGRISQAREILHKASDSRSGPLAEWLDWRTCVLMQAEASPQEARGEFVRYRGRHAESLRMDRLEWMDLDAMAALGLSKTELRTQALSILERWPATMLQDALRRRLREWDEKEETAGRPSPDTPTTEGPAR